MLFILLEFSIYNIKKPWPRVPDLAFCRSKQCIAMGVMIGVPYIIQAALNIRGFATRGFDYTILD